MANGSLTEQVTEQVADHLEEAAQVTRQIDKARIGLLVGGLAVGAAVGFYLGYRLKWKQIRAEEMRRAEEEILKIRMFYHETYGITKPSPEEVVEEKGYEVRNLPDVVTEERPTRPPVVVQPPPAPPQVRMDLPPEKAKDEGWDWDKERAQRTEERPYIIHQNEFNAEERGYNQVMWTYYAADNILADEHEQPVAYPERVVGEDSLRNFGLGADDHDVIFVRNDKIEMEFEIVRTNKSYESAVRGLDPDDVDTS
jgi:hypothetical protein